MDGGLKVWRRFLCASPDTRWKHTGDSSGLRFRSSRSGSSSISGLIRWQMSWKVGFNLFLTSFIVSDEWMRLKSVYIWTWNSSISFVLQAAQHRMNEDEVATKYMDFFFISKSIKLYLLYIFGGGSKNAMESVIAKR